MGKLNPFKKPKKPDDSALRAQEAKFAEQEKKLAADEKAREELTAKKEKATLNARRGRGGKNSLLSGLETGVKPEEEKRGNLG